MRPYPLSVRFEFHGEIFKLMVILKYDYVIFFSVAEKTVIIVKILHFLIPIEKSSIYAPLSSHMKSYMIIIGHSGTLL